MAKKFLFVICVIVIAAFATIFFVGIENFLVFQPKGVIARQEFHLIIINTLLMLSIIIPTFALLLITAEKYRRNTKQEKYEPEKTFKIFKQSILWVIPSIIVAVMAFITWKATHALDPYKPLESEVKELTIQVVAMDWKWLFIYPEQEIATLNFVQFPERTPIRFELAADGSPMNSFWIPELSGQIYCMAGMVTALHVMADGQGTYSGKAAEINGRGYSKMTFVAKSSSASEFESWISQVKQSSVQLDEDLYNELVKPSIDHPVQFYSKVKKDLFRKIVMKVNAPH